MPHVFIHPISGGHFCYQLGILGALAEEKEQPDILLTASGGTVAALTCMAGNWTKEGIERVSASLKAELFLKSWWSDSLPLLSSLPSSAKGLFNGSLYKNSDMSLPLMQQLFTPVTIKRKELWILTCEYQKRIPRVFCNLSAKESHLGESNFFLHNSRGNSTIFLDGNLEKIALVAAASASHPIYAEGVMLDGVLHLDGGLCAASPLSIMDDIIYKRTTLEPLHMTYITGLDLEERAEIASNFVKRMKDSLAMLVNSLTISDRAVAISILRRHGDRTQLPISYFTLKCGNNPSAHRILRELRKISNYTLVEYYVPNAQAISISSFTGEDVIAGMKIAQEEYRARIWYLGAETIYQEIKEKEKRRDKEIKEKKEERK